MNDISHRLQQRYRAAAPKLGALNETLDLLLAHRTVRHFLPDKLPAGTLETLIAAAQSASSSSNLQCWSVIAVEDKTRKARLEATTGGQPHMNDAPLLLVWLVDLHRLGQLGAERGEPAAALEYLESFILGAVDTALAAQNAMVALESLGLGGVYLGSLRNKPLEVAAELGLPPNVFALFGLSVGYPDPARPADVKPRLPQEVVLFRETYAWGAAQREGVAAYNAHLREFQREQGMKEQDWTVQAGARVNGPAPLHGRDELRAALHHLGFVLR